MSSVTVIGLQWGDEGKGKFVDFLAGADYVVRFQGGHNAGHTLVIGDEVYKFNILPSGVVREKTVSVIGNGVVLSLDALIRELDSLSERGQALTPQRLWVADNTCLVLSVHQELDSLREEAAGKGSIGTTLRGIGPAYEDKVGRRAVRLMDLAYPDSLRQRLARLAEHHNPLRKAFGVAPLNLAQIEDHLFEQYRKIKPYQKPVWSLLGAEYKAGKKILFEGGQGVLLDIDHGTYPFVTSSNTVASQAAAGSGLGAKSPGCVLGITKAYTTRVGAGAFPTELTDALGEKLGVQGNEFGTTTGRKRRCGWLDMVLLRQACSLSGVDLLAITKLDVLDGFDEIKMATSYKLNGDLIDYFPSNPSDQARLEVCYETFPGWQQSTQGITRLEDLPREARGYLDKIESLSETPAAFISTGAKRDHTIVLKDPFTFSV